MEPSFQPYYFNRYFSENPMKSIITAAAFVFLTILLVGSASFDVRAVEGAMKGIEPTYRGGNTGVSHGSSVGGATCSAGIQRCKKYFPASAAACASAGASCMQTGTFTNPQGKSTSGLIKN
jgi:hypothetical protein